MNTIRSILLVMRQQIVVIVGGMCRNHRTIQRNQKLPLTALLFPCILHQEHLFCLAFALFLLLLCHQFGQTFLFLCHAFLFLHKTKHRINQYQCTSRFSSYLHRSPCVRPFPPSGGPCRRVSSAPRSRSCDCPHARRPTFGSAAAHRDASSDGCHPLQSSPTTTTTTSLAPHLPATRFSSLYCRQMQLISECSPCSALSAAERQCCPDVWCMFSSRSRHRQRRCRPPY